MLKYLPCIMVFAVIVVLCSPAHAQQEITRFRYALWGSENSAKMKVSSPMTIGSEFTLNDLGMDKRDTIEVWELEVWQGSVRMDLSYWENRWDGYAQINHDIIYEGATYPAGAVVDSNFRVRATDISLNFGVTRGHKSAFSIVGGMKYMEYKSKLWDIAGEMAKEEAVVPIPYVGASAEFLIGEQTVLGGRFVMFQYDYSGTHVEVSNFYQADAYIEFRAGVASEKTGLALRIGFHNMVITCENHTPGDRFEITHMMKGTYAAFYLSF